MKKTMRTKTLYVKYDHLLELDEKGFSKFPNFCKTGSISGMKKQFYGEDALLVKCGSFIYNVTSKPEIYYQWAH